MAGSGRESNDDIAVLIGNGLSIAYNSDLAMGPLTESILERFKDPLAGDDTDAAGVLAGLATEKGAVGNFEALLGPLDGIGEALGRFESLAKLTSSKFAPGDVAHALCTVQRFLIALQRLGVGHALEVIDGLARARQDELAVVQGFVEAIGHAASTANVTIGNLNYDSLVMSALLSAGRDLCDMADGRSTATKCIGGPQSIEGHPLRREQDFPRKKYLLLHLHGSVSWLRESGSGDHIYRFQMDDIRTCDFWKNYRDRKTAWSPVVVLTNQKAKSSLVSRWPFSLAYEAFYKRLVASDRWLIAGYSFGDECVNKVLAQALSAHDSQPRVLVVTRSTAPTERAILAALGWSADALTEPGARLFVSRNGVCSAPQSAEWRKWKGRCT